MPLPRSDDPIPKPPPRRTIAEWLRELRVASPRQIDARLAALGYRGQARARKAACVLAYRHVRRAQRLYGGAGDADPLARENALFLGPTGCGKTYLVELLFREVLEVPTVLVDATQFSETGYVGDDVNTMLSRLFEAAGGELAFAACGVLCVDEFDKLASSRSDSRFAGQQTTKDVSGFGVQRGLLSLLSAQSVDFPPDFGFTSRIPPIAMPMAGITFIACGAFSGFKGTAEAMGAAERLGFGRAPKKQALDAIAVKVEEDHLEKTSAFARYGFLPELIGRFNRLVAFEPLDEGTLREILTANVLGAYAREFEQEGLRLTVEPAVLDAVVKNALRRETGARGLRAGLAPKLEEAAYEAFGAGTTGEVVLAMDGEEIACRVR